MSTELAASAFPAYFVALLAAHNVADHWVQTSHQACTKALRDRRGSIACLAHVTSYTVTTCGFGLVVWFALGLHLTAVGFLAGQAVSAVTHYWADRRYTLAWLAGKLGRGEFYQFGAPRPGRDDNPSLGTGAYALDQAFHWFFLFTAAAVTVLT
jgi:hypothetical protein